jgi:hypothetical protein
MKRLLAISLVVLSSFAYGQTSTATAPDANKLVYKGAPAWSLQSNKREVMIMYVDGTSEKIPWSSLFMVGIAGRGEDQQDVSACTGTTTTLDRPLKAAILIMFDDGSGKVGKRMCIPFTAKVAPPPAAQQ